MKGPSLRGVPSVDEVLRSPVLAAVLSEYRRDLITRVVREQLERARHSVRDGADASSTEVVANSVNAYIRDTWTTAPQRVVNATGVILHTNLARAPLSDDARKAMLDAAGYATLEFDVHAGSRGDRQIEVGRQLVAVTGAKAAFVTVNAASAVLLALAAHAKGREVIVSRGQSVEIGGGFRIPVILQQSGAKLIEVGTTNRTRLDDYEAAVTHRTASILHVHPSNFRISGFTESVSVLELARLTALAGIVLIDDNGSGALLDTAQFGLAHEPTVQESIQAGSDIVAFSGDKLFGGPQCGILVGTPERIATLAKHPLARALRPDKLTLAALSATLVAYMRGTVVETVPVWRMIALSADSLHARALDFVRRAAQAGIDMKLSAGESTVGGGSLPGETMPTTLLVAPPHITANELRMATPPIIARTHEGRTLLDLRTVAENEEREVLCGLLQARAE